MEIRALSGFNQETRQEYGKPYSPLSGCTVLGGIHKGVGEVMLDKEIKGIQPKDLIIMGLMAYIIYKAIK